MKYHYYYRMTTSPNWITVSVSVFDAVVKDGWDLTVRTGRNNWQDKADDQGGAFEYSKKGSPNGLQSVRIESVFTMPVDINRIVGQEHIKRAIEVAVTGRHGFLIWGPQSSGKTPLILAAHALCRQAWPNDRHIPCYMETREVTDRSIDRVDMVLEAHSLREDDKKRIAMGVADGEHQATILARIITGIEFAEGKLLHLELDQNCLSLMDAAVKQLQFGTADTERVKKVARTIANLECSDNINMAHLAEAIQYNQHRYAVEKGTK